MTEPSGDVIVD